MNFLIDKKILFLFLIDMTSLLERKISSVPKYTVLQEDSPSSFEYFASCCTRSLIDWFPKCMGILSFFWCS